MQIKKQIDAILQKRMDRQEFFKHIAIGVVAVSGAGAALRLMSRDQKPSADGGYGSSAYGGVNNSRSSGGLS